MEKSKLLHEDVTRSVIGAFYEVYHTLGFGFLEQLYQTALERELLARGHHVAREVSIRVQYKGFNLGVQRVDMLVDEKVIVEVKSTFSAEKWVCSSTSAPNLLFTVWSAYSRRVSRLELRNLLWPPPPKKAPDSSGGETLINVAERSEASVSIRRIRYAPRLRAT